MTLLCTAGWFPPRPPPPLLSQLIRPNPLSAGLFQDSSNWLRTGGTEEQPNQPICLTLSKEGPRERPSWLRICCAGKEPGASQDVASSRGEGTVPSEVTDLRSRRDLGASSQPLLLSVTRARRRLASRLPSQTSNDTWQPLKQAW